MQAIKTKFLGPTDHRGARVVARCTAGRHIVAWDHNKDQRGNHDAAAMGLAELLGWCAEPYGPWHRGGLGNSGYVYVECSVVTKVSP